MISARLVNQIISRPFIVNKGEKLNSLILWTRLFLNDTNPSLKVSKWSVYLYMTMFLIMYLSLPVTSLSIKDLHEWRLWNGHHQILIWIWSKIYGQLWRWNYLKMEIKADLWEAIKTTMSEIEHAEVKNK